MTISESLAARVTQMVSAEGGDAAASDSASEGAPNAPPHAEGGLSGVESGADAPGDAGEGAAAGADSSDEQKARATKHALLDEKLREARERRQAQRVAAEARHLSRQAAEDRQAAAAERAKYEGLRNGNFKEVVLAMGLDPAEAFQEMQEEAKRAGAPEASQKRMQERFERSMREAVEPLKAKIDELEADRAQLAAREEGARFLGEFQRVLPDEQYSSLREEYDDRELYDFALGVKRDLTRAGKRFTILDVLSVLKSAQDDHNAKREARRNRLQTANKSQAPQGASEKPTVNGTAERRNAGTTLGNDLASSRASGESSRPRQSRAERIRKLIEESEG